MELYHNQCRNLDAFYSEKSCPSTLPRLKHFVALFRCGQVESSFQERYNWRRAWPRRRQVKIVWFVAHSVDIVGATVSRIGGKAFDAVGSQSSKRENMMGELRETVRETRACLHNPQFIWD
jgi:hypothetical protein